MRNPRVSRGLVALAVLGAFGCRSDTSLTAVDARVTLNPMLVDLEPTLVGDVVPFEITLEHTQGSEVEVLAVDVVNTQGDAFAYEGEPSFVLEMRSTERVEMLYRPTDVGYHIAAIQVTTNARNGTFMVEARGSAAEPDIVVQPAAVDFGAVTAPDTATGEVVVQNQGALPIAITEAVFSDTRFALGPTLPVTVEGGNQLTLPVLFTPLGDETVDARLDLRVGQMSLDSVVLRANDCENGSPTLYDADGDGWTSCGGDCDDSSADNRPGGLEVPDGVDQDCDGLVDEGTTAVDDDGDGFCDDDTACTDGSVPGDCHDGDAAIHPDATEDPSNGIDDDCNGSIDAGSADGDGDGYTSIGGDCDDALATVHPGAPEIADGLDNDCDLVEDEGTTLVDDDGDGYCEDATSCTDGAMPGDCDDALDTSSPAGTEIPDGADNDCDGTVDEGTVNFDNDGDGFTGAGGDCDDGDPTVNPARGNCP